MPTIDGAAELRKMYDQFKRSFVEMYAGNDDFCTEIARRLVAYRTGVTPANSCVGHYLLVGSTGTGKTYAAECVAAAANMTVGIVQKYMIYLNGGEYSNSHDVARLTGAPPGYLGHKETTPVFNASAISKARSEQNPWGVTIVIFDEIDKAHESVRNLMLGVSERGMITTGDGVNTSVKPCLFFYTSNAGQEVFASKRLGYGKEAPKYDQGLAKRAVGKILGMPFINRMDKIYSFKDYTPQEKADAIAKQCRVFIRSMGEPGLGYSVDDKFCRAIVKEFDLGELGLREIVRRAKDIVRDRILDNILEGAPLSQVCLTAKDVTKYKKESYATVGASGGTS